MNGKLALLLVGAVLGAQPPADSNLEAQRVRRAPQSEPETASRRAPFGASSFEAAVKAAMATSIAQQRASVQTQATLGTSTVPKSTPSSFFTVPFPAAALGTADCQPLPAKQLDPLIEEAARKTGVEAQLVRAVIDQESGGRPCALSAKGAEGLMQLMPTTAEEFDVTAEEFDLDDAFDPKQNVEAGAKLLKTLLERYQNDPTLALGAYNAGSGRVDQAGGVPPIHETMDYVTAILDKLGFNKATEPSTGTSTTKPSVNDF
jgi:soluble lytic murein transglycosylase-like protein